MIYEEILREFQKKKVRYILVGGIAVNLLGSFRTTADMDVVVEMSNENLAKIVSILKKAGYRAKQPVDPMDIANERTRRDWIKNKFLKAFNFYKDNELKEVDIILKSPVSYETAKKDIKWIMAGKLRLPVISVSNLIKMKKNTGRDIDKSDIRDLKIITKTLK